MVGKSEQDATQALSQAGFNVGKITTDSTSTEPAGTVLQQSPGGGTRPSRAPRSDLTVSSGGAVKVPSVVGESVTDAISSLSQAGLTVHDRDGHAARRSRRRRGLADPAERAPPCRRRRQ